MFRHVVCVDNSSHRRKQRGSKEPAIVGGLKHRQKNGLRNHGFRLLLMNDRIFNQITVYHHLRYKMLFFISQQPQRIRHDNQRAAFVENDGNADADDSCQGCDNEQGNYAE